MDRIKFFQVDAFTNKPFKGNPAAICIFNKMPETAVMQKIAAENNLAETAFVAKNQDGFDLRWFTPTVEVDLCGHATLATAHILWQEQILPADARAHFQTRSGLLKASKTGNWIELDFPASPVSFRELPAGIQNALYANPVNTAFAKDRYIVEFISEEEVRAIKPDFEALKAFDMVVITAKADAGSPYDFISRTFGPAWGIDEDPVTGSSHCGLLPYWSQKLGRDELFAYQASERGGELKLKQAGNRVLISGEAVTVIEGSLII